ncbi:putative metal-dependent peptidase [hydrocarbon metagenome]|uniref:Putative metal-dependent peptidase n=1 Tax=hydrocarbon metagenome TaxID=938273 RepID=A0A0W8E5T9_9ZZZZ
MGYLIFILPALLLSIYAQYKVSATFKKYSQVRSSRGTTGADVAGTILRRNNMNIRVEPVAGSLSDHYDPRSKVVRLSESVYGSDSISAIGVAAHEVGHALQHRDRYGLLEIRHKLVPVTNFSSSASFPILLIGFFLNNLGMVYLGIILFSVVVLFHLVTLPVELNASRRAVALLSENGLVSGAELPGVKSVLGAAALTYLAATLSAVSSLLYYLMIFTGGSDN